MGHPRTLALYVSAAMLAIVVAALLLVRSGGDAPPELPPRAQAAGEPKPDLARELDPLPEGRDVDWRAVVQAEAAEAGQPGRAIADPARAVQVFGFVHTPDGQLAKSRPVQWNRKAQSTLQVEFARPPGSTDERAEPRGLNVIDGRYEGDLPAGTWVVSVAGQALSDDLQNYVAFVAPLPLLRELPAGSKTRIDFDFRAIGTCSVHGTIRDEAGQPFGGLAVATSELHALADPSTGAQITLPRSLGVVTSAKADGSFTIPNLPPGRFRLFVEPEGYKPIGPPGVSAVGELVQPRELTLFNGPMTLELTIRRPHPVHVIGRVDVDPAWAEERGLAGQVPTIELVRSAGREDIPEVRDPIALGAWGFEFWIDSGVQHPRLELFMGGETIVQPLVLPAAGELAPLAIRFPR